MRTTARDWQTGAPEPKQRHRSGWPAGLVPVVLAAVLMPSSRLSAQTAGEANDAWNRRHWAVTARSAARQPSAPALIGGFPTPLPTVPHKEPLPATDVLAFVDSAGTSDAVLEVLLGQGRLLTLKEDLAAPNRGLGLIAVGDPSVVDFTVVSPRQIRLLGLRLGTTDLSITTPAKKIFTFEVRVVADLDVLGAQLRALFPDASVKLAQLRDHVVVEGEARDAGQITRIIATIQAYLVSVQATELRKISGQSVGPAPVIAAPVAKQPPNPPRPDGPVANPATGREPPPPQAEVSPERGGVSAEASVPEPRIINLLRVPGPQQVLLKVRVAELNRTALRHIGADVLGVDPATGAIVGTQIGGAAIGALGTFIGSSLLGTASGTNTPTTTVFGILDSSHFEFLLSALRSNSILRVLAEPNLVAMSGQQASFLAGGEFPVPVPQTSSGGAAPVVTVEFREFGVRLGFLPFILDHDLIRLTVDPEVSTIDFTLGTVLVPGGTPVPGLNTRRSHTTVELRQGQTLAIAGLLQLTLDGSTSRIPIMGDLPILGPFFSNTSNRRTEKELVVLVTPYLVEPMKPGHVPPTPGDEVSEPTDWEAYLGNRIEGRPGHDFRSTTYEADPLHIRQLLELENQHVRGAHGFTD